MAKIWKSLGYSFVRLRGNSMYPFFRSGDEIIVDFSFAHSNLRRGTIVLIRPLGETGQFFDLVVHRVIEFKSNRIITKGDYSIHRDGESEVVAVVCGFQRNGQTYVWRLEGHPLQWVFAIFSKYRSFENYRILRYFSFFSLIIFTFCIQKWMCFWRGFRFVAVPGLK